MGRLDLSGIQDQLAVKVLLEFEGVKDAVETMGLEAVLANAQDHAPHTLAGVARRAQMLMVLRWCTREESVVPTSPAEEAEPTISACRISQNTPFPIIQESKVTVYLMEPNMKTQ